MTNVKIQRRPVNSITSGRRIKRLKFLIFLLVPVLMFVMFLGSFTKLNVNMTDDEESEEPITIINDDRKTGAKTVEVTEPVNASAYDNTSSINTVKTREDAPKLYTDRDVEVVAKTVYGEALVTQSDMEMAAVVWCILNRVDSEGYGCGESIEYVTTFPDQFHGYSPENPVTDHIKQLVIDVFERWSAEKNGEEDVGRVLPKEYIYFWGDGGHNYFTTEFLGGETWKWEVENPYDN